MIVLLQYYVRATFLTITAIGLCVLFALPASAQRRRNPEVERRFDEGKLEIVCQAIQFYLKANARENASNNIDCSTLETIEESIPEEYKATARFFRLFKKKRYGSYGSEQKKLARRLEKLIKDINTELSKVRKDTAWNNRLTGLIVDLDKVKVRTISGNDDSNHATDTTNTSQQTNTVQQTKKTTPKKTGDSPMSIFLSIVSLLAAGALGYMAYTFRQKLEEITEQLDNLDEAFKEKYSRLDNRIDTMTPVRDFRTIDPQIQQIHGDIQAIVQEIQLMRTRNQFKISPEELYAKRTEHLETHSFNPEIQIYYARFDKDQNGFNHNDFRTEPDKEHLYKIEISVDNPIEAMFQIVSRNEYHHLALNYEGSMLAPAAEYLNRPVNAYRIITKKPGKVVREQNSWIITEKAALEFE